MFSLENLRIPYLLCIPYRLDTKDPIEHRKDNKDGHKVKSQMCIHFYDNIDTNIYYFSYDYLKLFSVN